MKTIKIKLKNSLKSKIKDFIFNSTMVKAVFSELKRKIQFINKQKRHTNNFYKQVSNFLI